MAVKLVSWTEQNGSFAIQGAVLLFRWCGLCASLQHCDCRVGRGGCEVLMSLEMGA